VKEAAALRSLLALAGNQFAGLGEAVAGVLGL